MEDVGTYTNMMEDECDGVPIDGMLSTAEPKKFDVNTWFEEYVLPKPQPTYSFYGYTQSSDDKWKPNSSLYAPYGRRLMSFDKWPRQIRQTAVDMAGAGFYYLGSGDGVKCFHCGIGIQNWETKDNALMEHKRLSPFCKYLEMTYSA